MGRFGRWARRCVLGLLGSSVVMAQPPVQRPVRVYAAASLTELWTDLAELWRARGHPAPVVVLGGSGELARQLRAGAPGELYASADPRWMEELEAAGWSAAGSRVELLGNTLVLIAPRSSTVRLFELDSEADLPARFQGRLCMGEPDAVPAGRYAREALQHYGWWDALAPRVAASADVRGALMFVARGECAFGIVYATDAQASTQVRVVARFPPHSHRPIVYPFALARNASAQARDVLHWLRTDPAAHQRMRARGFRVLEATP